MSKNTLLKTGEIGVFALGGLGEVGKNTYVYEINNQIFVVDAGILFPDDDLLGIDYVIPDYTYLKENEDRIVGLFITHGHEDHIGGIPYLLRQVKIPRIYASGIAVDLIEYKLGEHKDLRAPKIEEYKSYYTYNFKDVVVSFIRLNHSIPDMFGIVFRTPEGPLFHTGDFKIDYTPVGPHAEYEKLANLGQEGTLLLVSDSTNAEQDGLIQSESKVGRSINELFTRIPGRIIIATFASNLYRIQQIIEAAELTGRKIAVFGRSMERTIEAGQQSGYIKPKKGTIVGPEELKKYTLEETCILVTGSQGEPLAALSRISNGSHRQIKTVKGDTVIFSSSPIPGNQDPINKTINLLFRNDVNVITHGPITDTHTSGHGSGPDLKLMLTLVKPKHFIPMHGEHRMLKRHKQLAVECGVDPNNILIMDNGDVAALNKESIRYAGKVQAGDIYIDGTGIGNIGSNVLRERKILSEEGLFSVILSIDLETKTLINEPTVISRGFIYMKGNEELTSSLASMVKHITLRELPKKSYNELNLKQMIIDQLSDKIYDITLRKPMILPIIMNI
ncbi:ribonuclease J [Acholeplasma laidlawii]|uniref:Ribonuclease J n=1 Tax=Acholeplasma laidlawii TaxID=2148 RepID=A0A553IJ74_ACHLA|nr:ribonuclease J [Acholeplasma laidlawii]NWH11893.1 ribonuclease J [Acholeplasma laidlawii]NWH12699.1 ribonuclease J [Acholeplasma laidlawii]TRY00239.1 ribonuclease J [Acholeplasma laidlawii]